MVKLQRLTGMRPGSVVIMRGMDLPGWSGMSYVGQWENRLLAILREAKRRNRVLYFDDLLGIFAASSCR